MAGTNQRGVSTASPRAARRRGTIPQQDPSQSLRAAGSQTSCFLSALEESLIHLLTSPQSPWAQRLQSGKLELGSPSCEELTTGPTISKCVWLLNTKGSRRMWAQAHRLSPLPWSLGSWDHRGSCRFQQCRQNILSRKRRPSPFFLNEGGTQEATGRHSP